MQPVDRRKRGSSFLNCFDFGSTAEGSASLRNPYSVNSPMSLSTGPIKGLDPKKRKRRKTKNNNFEDDLDDPASSSSGTSYNSASNIYPEFKPIANELSTVPTSFVPASSVPTDSKNNTIAWATQPPSKFINAYFRNEKPKRAKPIPQKNTLMNYMFTKTSPVKSLETERVSSSKVGIIRGLKANGSFSNSQSSPARSDSPDVEIIEVSGPTRNSHSSNASSSINENQNPSQEKQNTSDPYGLIGLGDPNEWKFDSDDNNSQDYTNRDLFSGLPEHILEHIFGLVPLTDLLLSISVVCHRFHEITQNEKFLLWKKRYHQLKAKEKLLETQMDGLLLSHGMENLEDVLPNLPGCLRDFRRKKKDDSILIECLQLHSRYEWAITFLKENTEDCFRESEDGLSSDPIPWCVVGALVVLSQNVADVYQVLQLLSRSGCHVVDIMEALYCLAAFLFHSACKHKALYNLHYYVFYALYQFENQWQARASDLTTAFHGIGQQNIMKYSEGDVKMTHEQMRIVRHPLSPNQIVKVVAFAGTGKTSTLVHFARLRQGLKFLLIVYNKAAQEHASKTFPGNVECRTINSLAFAGPGKRLAKKLVTKLRPLDIQKYLRYNKTMNLTRYSRYVLSTLDKFMASADPHLTLAHVLRDTYRAADEEPFTDDDALCVLQDSELIWSKMIDPRDFEVRCLHDTYLKLYQLEHPVWENYACVLVDEAQDCNPAMLDIVLSQKCPKILVGDPNQQIYSFRGAVNALESVPSTHTYYLTQSFRFGPEIAYIAHCTLIVLKNIFHKTLVGGNQESHVTGHFQGQVAIIARSNASLFNEAVRLICKGMQKPHEPKPADVRGAFNGGLGSYNLQQLVDIYTLMQGEGHGIILDKFISRFKSFSALQAYAKNAKDVELSGKVSLVLQHTDKIPEYVTTIGDRCKYGLKFANVVFTTAHKSKGLEFDTVYLTDDYNLVISPVLSEAGVIHQLLTHPARASIEVANEYNILYVALTRAKKCLLICNSLHQVLRAAQEYFEVPVLLDNRLKNCALCIEPIVFEENIEKRKSFVLYRNPLTTMQGIPRSTGPLCRQCACPNEEMDFDSGAIIEHKARLALTKILGTATMEQLFMLDIDPDDPEDIVFENMF